MKWLELVLLLFSVFIPSVFAQTVEQKGCVEIISGTERHLQCPNVTPTTAQKGGKAPKLLTPEQRKDATKASKAAAKATPVYILEQMRDLEDSPEGPIISVAR